MAAKLRGIDDARVLELFRAGYLRLDRGPTCCRCGSLGRLVARLDDAAKVSDERGAIPGEAALAAPVPPTTH